MIPGMTSRVPMICACPATAPAPDNPDIPRNMRPIMVDSITRGEARYPRWPPSRRRPRRAAGAALAAAAGLAVAHAGPGITALGPVRRALFPRLAGQGAAGHVA